MLSFKTAELEAQLESQMYMMAPEHALKSINASAIHFLGRNTGRTSSIAQATKTSSRYTGVGSNNINTDGLRHELDNYLHKPLMVHYEVIDLGEDLGQGVTQSA